MLVDGKTGEVTMMPKDWLEALEGYELEVRRQAMGPLGGWKIRLIPLHEKDPEDCSSGP